MGDPVFVKKYILKLQSTRLRHPYGGCGESPLNYTHNDENYTLEACELECTTRNLNSTCGCIDAYMPDGKTTIIMETRLWLNVELKNSTRFI